MTRERTRSAAISQSAVSRIAALEGELHGLRERLALDRDDLELMEEAAIEAQRELELSRERYADLYDTAPTGFVALDRNGLIREANLTAASMLGMERPRLLDTMLSRFVAKEERRKLLHHLSQCRRRAGQGQVITELRVTSADGRRVDLELVSAPESAIGRTLRQVRFRTALVDITARKRAEEELREAHTQLERRVKERTAELHASYQALSRANRALRSITACHEALLRVTHETELFSEVCRVVVEIGGYPLAWVGLAEFDAKHSVRPVARAGCAAHHLKDLRISWAEGPRGRGPAGTAIRSGKPVLMRDLSRQLDFAPWQGFARRLGVASALGLPLVGEGRCFGALTIYAAEREAFDADEVKLLIQFANDLAFGVMALRARADSQRLQRELLEISERERRRIGQDLHDSVGQRIAGAWLLTGAVAHELAKTGSQVARDAARIEHALEQALEEIRQLARGLHPVHPGPETLMAALTALAKNVTEMFRVPCRFDCPHRVLITDHKAATHLYRIAQEATNNAGRHAHAKSIRIGLESVDGGIRLRVGDDGCGLAKKARSDRGFGLSIMRYRASVIGASISITSRRGGGTTVICEWRASKPACVASPVPVPARTGAGHVSRRRARTPG